jgi:SAM-dependent methyltransferase
MRRRAIAKIIPPALSDDISSKISRLRSFTSKSGPMISTYTATDAAAYERLMGRWSRLLATPFVAFAGIEDGDRILDVGCGTGSLAFVLAARREPSAIVGLDISEPYVAHARVQAVDARLSFRVGDAVALDFPDESFDRCYSLLALNFVPQPAQAVREMKRVTRAGGTIAAAVWDFMVGAIRLVTRAARYPRPHRGRAIRRWEKPLEAELRRSGEEDVGAVLGASVGPLVVQPGRIVRDRDKKFGEARHSLRRDTGRRDCFISTANSGRAGTPDARKSAVRPPPRRPPSPASPRTWRSASPSRKPNA